MGFDYTDPLADMLLIVRIEINLKSCESMYMVTGSYFSESGELGIQKIRADLCKTPAENIM